MRLGGALLVCLAAISTLGVAGAGSAAPARSVHFTTLWRTVGEGTGKLPFTTGQTLSAAAVVWQRMGDALNTGPTFVSGARLARLEQFPRSKRFPLLVAIVRSTTGYSITVKRITYQHPTAEIDQFCVIATVTKPRAGEPVEHRRTVSTHAVQIDRRGFGLAFSSGAILRSSDGTLLSKTTAFGPVRPTACRA